MIREGLNIAIASLVAAGWAYWLVAWISAREFLTRAEDGRQADGETGRHGDKGTRTLPPVPLSPCPPVSLSPCLPVPNSPRVSILKSIKGVDAHAYENFATFAKQDYDNYEILFAVTDPNDPVIPEIHRLQREFPHIPIRWVIAGNLGANPKCANLHRLVAESTADILVLSDGDIRVTPDYLSRVIAPLADPSIGLVTCLYRGLLPQGLPARIESLHMDVTFLPAVVLAHRLGQRIGMGATLALRRADLLRTGGFAAIADHLMDDYQLAALIEGLGLKTCLSDYVVGSVIGRSRLSDQWAREVRWSRGIRVTCPGKYWGLLVTYPTAWALALCIIGGLHLWMLIVLAGTLLLRWVVARDIEMLLRSDSRGNLLLLPVRDLLSFLTWCAGLAGNRITWRGQDFVLQRDGRLQSEDPTPDRRGLFSRLIRRFDRFLRRREGIFEYNTDADCMLRVSLGVFDEPLNLSDGTSLSPGDPVCDLHLFNDHMPAIGPDGPGLAWAIQLQRGFRNSLVKLAGVFETDPRFAHAKAIRAQTIFVTRRGVEQLQRITERLHFELQDPVKPPSLGKRLHNMGENLLLWALVWTFNPGGLRNAKLKRERHWLFMSREMLLSKYRSPEKETPDDAGRTHQV